MANNKKETLGIEESNELAIRLLRDFWFAQVRALVDSIGSEATVEAMTPYFKNSAIAGTMFTKRLLGLDKIGFVEIAEIWGLQNLCVGFDHLLVILEDGVLYRLENKCSFFDAPKEVCTIYCDIAANYSCQALDPEWTYDLEMGDLDGGPYCKGRGGYLHLKGNSPPCGTELMRKARQEFEARYPLSLRQDLGIQYFGEFVVLTTNAASDALGDKAFMEIMSPAMFEHGKEVGRTVLREHILATGKRDSLRAVDFVNHVIKQSGDFQYISEGKWSKEIGECPFSHAPKEFCSLFQKYLEGICNSFDANSWFSYSICMTSGASSCLSELRLPVERGHRPPNHLYDDHLMMLKMRLAKGEISEEEYVRLKRLILEDL
jgi:hypothetical protein